MKKTTLLLTLAVLVLGCDGKGRYEIVGDGTFAYRLDVKTGEMLYIVRGKATLVKVVPREDLYK